MKKSLIQLHIAVFLAGFTAVLGKLILLNEVLLVGYRLLIAVITLWVIRFLKKDLNRINWNDCFKFLGVGAIVAIHWITFYGSVKYANVSVALVCFSATSFFTAILEPLISKTSFSVSEIGLGLLAIIGIYIIFDFNPQFKRGIIFGLISALGSALFPIFNKSLLIKFSPQTVTLFELSGGLLAICFMIPFYLNTFPASYYLPTNSDWFWLFILAWLCTVISFTLQLNALKNISAFTANLTYNLEPVYGIILAVIIFNENKQFNSKFYIGAVCIFASIILQMLILYKKNSASANK